MRLYLELARSGYRRYAAYPAATWAGLFTNVVFGLVIGSILLALNSDTRDTVGGYTRQDALTYTCMTQGAPDDGVRLWLERGVVAHPHRSDRHRPGASAG